MGPLELIQKRGLEAINRFYGIYRAIVTDNVDVDKQNRIRVVVPQVDPELNVWAYPMGQQALANAGTKHLTPPLASVVWVQYENGDPLYPVWSNGHWAAGEIPEGLDGNALIGMITPNGNQVVLNEDDGLLTIKVVGEEEVTITIQNGNIKVTGSTIDLLEAEYGIPKSDLVTQRLNTIETDLNNLKTLLAAAPSAASSGDGGRTALATFASYAGSVLTPTEIEDIANPNIKQ